MNLTKHSCESTTSCLFSKMSSITWEVQRYSPRQTYHQDIGVSNLMNHLATCSSSKTSRKRVGGSHNKKKTNWPIIRRWEWKWTEIPTQPSVPTPNSVIHTLIPKTTTDSDRIRPTRSRKSHLIQRYKQRKWDGSSRPTARWETRPSHKKAS